MLRPLPRSWSLPAEPWVLHSTPTIGNLTDRWIDIQAKARRRYETRLLALQSAPAADPEPHWLIAKDRCDLGLAYRGMYKSDGLSPVWNARSFRANPPEAVHVHYGPPAAQLVRFARALDRPLIASFYGYDATRVLYTDTRLWRRRYRRLFANAAAVVVEGPRMAERVTALGCPSEKVAVVRLPADEDGLIGIEARPARSFRAVVAGRFVEKKGFDTAIEAFARAFSPEEDAELHVIGGGPLEGSYRALAARLGVDRRIRWQGRLDFKAYMSCIASAHVALYPSRVAANGDSEGGAPVTLIEAQWLGVPSLIARHDDLEFVAGESAIALESDAVDEWAQALRLLYEDPGELTRRSDEARRFARSRHAPATNAAEREQLYGRAI
jgi:colanic acid/amylovoran biosynthesis glycosyltransferase